MIESPQTQSNLKYVWGLTVSIWDDYLARPVLYLWNDIFIDLLWNSFIDNLQRIKAGEPTTIEQLAPEIIQ